MFLEHVLMTGCLLICNSQRCLSHYSPLKGGRTHFHLYQLLWKLQTPNSPSDSAGLDKSIQIKKCMLPWFRLFYSIVYSPSQEWIHYQLKILFVLILLMMENYWRFGRCFLHFIAPSCLRFTVRCISDCVNVISLVSQSTFFLFIPWYICNIDLANCYEECPE